MPGSRREALSCQHAVYQWTEVVTSHMPHLSKPQAAVLALWSLGMGLARSCALTAVSLFLAKGLNRKANTVGQQLHEFCYEAKAKRGGPRQEVKVETCFAPLLAWGLSWGEGQQLALAVDATTLGDRFVVLVVSVLYRGCAIPVAWTVLPATEPHAWRREWLRMLRQVRAVVPRRFFVLVLADRGLYARWLFQRIVPLGWHPVLRSNTGGTFRPAASAHYQPLRSLVPQPGTQGGAGHGFSGTPAAAQLHVAGPLGGGVYRPLVIRDRLGTQCGRGLLVGAARVERARLQNHQTGRVAMAAHPPERSPASRAVMGSGGGGHLVVAQCRGDGGGDDSNEYAVAAHER